MKDGKEVGMYLSLLNNTKKRIVIIKMQDKAVNKELDSKGNCRY